MFKWGPSSGRWHQIFKFFRAFRWKSVSEIMSFRPVLAAMLSCHRNGLVKGYIRLQKCSFHVHFQRSGANAKNLDSHNLKLITTTWVQRLKEESVPEAELSVNIILNHVLCRDRVRVCICHVHVWNGRNIDWGVDTLWGIFPLGYNPPYSLS